MKLFLLIALLILTGCAGQVVEPNYYLMRASNDVQSGKMNPSSEFSMGKVITASYIDQAGLMIETGAGEIRAAKLHLWAEPISDGVRRQLMVEIGQALGKDLFKLKEQLENLENGALD